jgi:hypothetical protein
MCLGLTLLGIHSGKHQLLRDIFKEMLYIRGVYTCLNPFNLKGQSNEIFSSFFMKRLTLVLIDTPKAILNFVEFSRTYSYSKYLEIDSLLSWTVGSQKLSLRQPIFLIIRNVPDEQCSTCIVDFLL